jgi:hypothetical protein
MAKNTFKDGIIKLPELGRYILQDQRGGEKDIKGGYEGLRNDSKTSSQKMVESSGMLKNKIDLSAEEEESLQRQID